jgi:hypothetical protein
LATISSGVHSAHARCTNVEPGAVTGTTRPNDATCAVHSGNCPGSWWARTTALQAQAAAVPSSRAAGQVAQQPTHPAHCAAHNWAAGAVGGRRVEPSFARVTVPAPTRHPGYAVAPLVHSHAAAAAVAQQNRVAARA